MSKYACQLMATSPNGRRPGSVIVLYVHHTFLMISRRHIIALLSILYAQMNNISLWLHTCNEVLSETRKMIVR